MRENVRIDAKSIDDRLYLHPETKGRRWLWRLTAFMRITSILWLIKGLSAWAILFGIWVPLQLFDRAPIGYQSIIVYFAVTDLIAAIGLWVATAWGGVLWLLAIVSNTILAIFFPEIVPGGIPILALFIVFVLVYLILSWLTSRETG